MGATHSTKMQEPQQIRRPSLSSPDSLPSQVENEGMTFALGKERILDILQVTIEPMSPREGAGVFMFQAEARLSSPRATAGPRG